jgi:hypothetical protein
MPVHSQDWNQNLHSTANEFNSTRNFPPINSELFNWALKFLILHRKIIQAIISSSVWVPIHFLLSSPKVERFEFSFNPIKASLDLVLIQTTRFLLLELHFLELIRFTIQNQFIENLTPRFNFGGLPLEILITGFSAHGIRWCLMTHCTFSAKTLLDSDNLSTP